MIKQLLRNHVTRSGKLDTVKVFRALLQYGNMKDCDTGFSPVTMLFGREVQDLLSQVLGRETMGWSSC